jgi:ribonuclease HI
MSIKPTTPLKALRVPTGLKKKLLTKSNDAKIYPICEYTLNFDGCSKGNPGYAGIGIVIYKNGEEIHSASKFIGIKTNNQSEYAAVIFGLEEALRLNISQISILGDSLLVINQINGIYKVKTEHLLELYRTAIELKGRFQYIEFNHVLRDQNKRADKLSNIALLQIAELENELDSTDTLIKELDEDWLEEEKLDDMSEKTVSRMRTYSEQPPPIKKSGLIDSFFPKLKKI